MNNERPEFQSGAVRPMECLRGGWQLIRNEYWLFFGISLVGVLIASAAPMAILAGPMMCGIYLCLLRKQRGERVKFEMLFKGFEHFVQSLIATLVMVIPVLVIVVPAYLLLIAATIASMPKQQGQPADPAAAWTFLIGFALFMLLIIVLSIVLGVLFFFTYPLIVDKRLTGMQAIGASIRAARANFGGVLGVVLLNFLIGTLGVLACYVGSFFVMPIHFAAIAVAYRQVFPADDQTEPPAGEPAALEPIAPE
jgi:hypothetical protein